MSQFRPGPQLLDVRTELPERAEQPATVAEPLRRHRTRPQLQEFERTYRRNVAAVMSYFARRCREPQIVADLTSETFVRAAAGFGNFDPDRGSDRAWLFGIAAHVFAEHCDRVSRGQDAVSRLGNHRTLDADEIDELAGRIDAEREGETLMRCFAELPDAERSAIELVDVDGLTPKEAAAALGISRVAFRKRLSRARAHLGNRTIDSNRTIDTRKGRQER